MPRGIAASVGPMPPRSAFKRKGSSFKLGKFEFGPGAAVTFRARSYDWKEAFIGGGLSKQPGPVGCYYDENGVTTWILHDYEESSWYIATVEPAPIPKIAKAPEPEKPRLEGDSTCVYVYLTDSCEAPNFEGRPGGFYTLYGREHSTDETLNYDCSVTGVHVEQVAKSGVVYFRSGGSVNILKYSRPSLLQRLMGYPAGWFQISQHAGHRTRFNSFAACAFWYPLTPIAVALLGIYLWLFQHPAFLIPWAIFLGPILYLTLYYPGRRHLPPGFFDDCCEQYVQAERVHKAVRAEELTHFSYFAAIFQQQR